MSRGNSAILHDTAYEKINSRLRHQCFPSTSDTPGRSLDSIAWCREFLNEKGIAVTGGTKMSGTLNCLNVAKILGPSGTLQIPYERHALHDAVAADLLT